MGWLSFLKSAPNAAEKTIDTIREAGDKLFYTDEEKADSDKELFKLWADSFEKLRDENSARSITRRYIACMVVGFWLLLTAVCVGSYPFDPEYSAFVFDVLSIQTPIVIGVSVFYFGPHLIGRAVQQARSKK